MGKTDIINKVRATIARHGMIGRGDRIIVALSGGPDSVCLLDVLHRLSDELEIGLIAAHYDHGLRGEEDAFETKLSKDTAHSMDVPFEAEKAPDHLKDSSSLEERAREARYEFLENVRVKHGAHKIAMGHNLNDQAETVIMRLLRGSGPSGLSGIPPVRDGIIIRPLIEISRDEIMEYLKASGVPFAVDSSNTSTVHLRNRIRHELMPMLLNYQPNLLERLGVLSDIIRDENAFLESMAAEWVERETKKITEGKISIPVSSIRDIPDPFKYRVIREILKRVNKDNAYPMEYDHVVSVAGLLDNQKPQCSVDLPDGIMVKKVYQTLHFSHTPPHPNPLPRGEVSPVKRERGIMGSPVKSERGIIGSPTKRERGIIGSPSKREKGFIVPPTSQLDKGAMVSAPHREKQDFMYPSHRDKETMFSQSHAEKESVASTSYGERVGEREHIGFKCTIDGPGTYQLDAVEQSLILEEFEKGKEIFKDGDSSTAYLEADKLEYPLVARSFTPGDRFVPLGMKGHRKVKDFFIDLKVPSEERARTPILISGDKIVWVCGYRIDERFKVTEETKKVIKVTWVT